MESNERYFRVKLTVRLSKNRKYLKKGTKVSHWYRRKNGSREKWVKTDLLAVKWAVQKFFLCYLGLKGSLAGKKSFINFRKFFTQTFSSSLCDKAEQNLEGRLRTS